jgi:hypothetical protein
LQIYLNRHHWLAAQLRKAQIDFTLLDNAFTQIADWEQAQRWADSWSVEKIHPNLGPFARRFYPVIADLQASYPWSLDRAE